MTYAPVNTSDVVLGSFYEKTENNIFEFSANENDKPVWSEYPIKVWVSKNAFRWAKVLKTVAYIVVDEDAIGMPVVEKWDIKKFRTYDR